MYGMCIYYSQKKSQGSFVSTLSSPSLGKQPDDGVPLKYLSYKKCKYGTYMILKRLKRSLSKAMWALASGLTKQRALGSITLQAQQFRNNFHCTIKIGSVQNV